MIKLFKVYKLINFEINIYAFNRQEVYATRGNLTFKRIQQTNKKKLDQKGQNLNPKHLISNFL